MTAQILEKIIIDGEILSMATCPPLPLGHPNLVEVDLENSGEIGEDIDDFIVFSTACWRKYQGLWEIKDGKLYLVSLRGRYNLTGHDLIFANWFTGLLRVPRGKMLKYIHFGFSSVYEEEVRINISQGSVVDVEKVLNRFQDNCHEDEYYEICEDNQIKVPLICFLKKSSKPAPK